MDSSSGLSRLIVSRRINGNSAALQFVHCLGKRIVCESPDGEKRETLRAARMETRVLYKYFRVAEQPD